MEIDKEKINLIYEKMNLVLFQFIPGLIILDVGLQKGLFSGTITTIWDFILVIIWSCILTIPFDFLIPGNLRNISLDVGKIAKEYLKEKFKEEAYHKSELYENYKIDVTITYTVIRLGFLIMIFEVLQLVHFSRIIISFFQESNIVKLLFSYIVSTAILYPIGNLYAKYLVKKMRKIFKKLSEPSMAQIAIEKPGKTST